jgi:DNA-binding CsgD family transcriptional regulator/peroxiredoxin
VALTEREREVANLVAAGLTNAEISERLGITFATAKWHVSQVLAKLDVQHREDVRSRLSMLSESPPRRPRWNWLIPSFGSWKALGPAAAALPIAGITAITMAALLATGGPRPVPQQPSPIATPVEVLQEANSPANAFSPLMYQGEVLTIDPGHCDFASRDLTGLWAPNQDLSGCDFSNADLEVSMLNGSDLSGSNLQGTLFRGATAGGANFAGANLREAVFHNTILQGANFTDADLTGADLNNAIVSASWRGATCPDGLPADDRGGTCVGTPGVEYLPTTRSTEVSEALAATQQLAPDFALRDARDPATTHALSGYRGKPVVLVWYVSWCGGPCLTTLISLYEAQAAFGDKALILAMNLRESPARADAILREVQVDLPVALDETGSAAWDYGVIGAPSTFAIDAEGRIVAFRFGALTAADVDALLASAGVIR